MKTIYISGPITDLTTGQPREGWQRDFLDAEAKLRSMGFYVLNPVDIARNEEESFAWRNCFFGGLNSSVGKSSKPTRTDYIMACLERMRMYHGVNRLHGVYVIGDAAECYRSRGVQMELSLAEILDIPIYAACQDGDRVDHNIVLHPGTDTIEDFAKEILKD